MSASSPLLSSFLDSSLDEWMHGNDGTRSPPPAQRRLLALAASASRDIPAYASVCPTPPTTFQQFLTSFPFLTKSSFIIPNPMASRCRHSDLSALETLHASSGSSGQPTFWGRTADDEVMTAARFEQVLHDNFDCQRVRTLAVVAFPLGSWVGGVFTYNCLRYLKRKNYLVTQVTPGNNVDEILKLVQALSPSFQQTLILGYPPFVKGVIDKGLSQGVGQGQGQGAGAGQAVPWASFNLGFIFAGEVFSEEFRALVALRAGIPPARALQRVVSVYGTADAGVLGVETPLSASIRHWLAGVPEVMQELFGGDRIPSLFQYDPLHRYFELKPKDGTLAFSTLPAVLRPKGGEGGEEDLDAACSRLVMPALRYAIGDAGGLMGFDDMLSLLGSRGFALPAPPPHPHRHLPFVWVFGRAHWTLSVYGANVYVENVMPGLEALEVAADVTGKFVLALSEDMEDCRLLVRVELSPAYRSPGGTDGGGDGGGDGAVVAAVAASILQQLLRLNSEYGCYVPLDKQLPRVLVYPFGDPTYFPLGVKHKYI